MRTYADSSFILRLLTIDPESEEAMTEYRRLDCPRLFFLPLHALEVRNGILQRAFHQRRSLSSGSRQHVVRERDAALSRLQLFIARSNLIELTLDLEAPLAKAVQLGLAHTELIGARAIDLLHVACALALESELFVTTDERQARLARAERLKVLSLA